ncbi:BadF/BadG/BcrA/BcrD ATPase family protein [Spirulina sp. CS-785/01]|uniref:BadF/BadG/BcrA/BcrD ATPase family protein n=1 Tax=Spirulina sp. CS-785/01 TaxID=3021716 RepID=UPI002330EF6B|nr:BadF/BadG/BcrA/BcrD ATPase family protein [Spirulina sp. CS-785/01]MDB9313863.1 BadF/BadG/BcrA/BcrD ATPase family protein [Spirulina sp. CS-785/01]
MKTDLYIGVDGGATKTIVRVEDGQGRVLGEGKGGSANIRHSVEKTWQSILSAIEAALKGTGITIGDEQYNWFCGAGIAGSQVPEAVEAFVNYPHPLTRLVVESDGYISCLGAHGGKDGAVIAVGTGVVAYQIEGETVTRVAGWGFPQGDEGSGAWLGLEAVRLTFRVWDGREAENGLVRAILAQFEDDFRAFTVWANGANSPQFAALAPVVIGEARRGEPQAVRLMEQSGREVDRIGEALAKRSRKGLPCSLLGGLATGVEPWLGEGLRSRLVPPQADAAQGGIILIRQTLATPSQ